MKQLHAAYLKLSVVAPYPNSVERGRKDTGEGEYDSQWRCGFDPGIICGKRIIVRNHANTETCWYQRDDCFSW